MPWSWTSQPAEQWKPHFCGIYVTRGHVLRHSVLSDPLRPHELQPARFPYPLGSPGRILEWPAFPTPGDWMGISSVSCISRWILYHSITNLMLFLLQQPKRTETLGYFPHYFWDLKFPCFIPQARFICQYLLFRASLVALRLMHLPAMWETLVWSLGQEDPLEKEKSTHSSILAWRIPWTEEPGKLQSTGLQRVRNDWALTLTFIYFLEFLSGKLPIISQVFFS